MVKTIFVVPSRHEYTSIVDRIFRHHSDGIMVSASDIARFESHSIRMYDMLCDMNGVQVRDITNDVINNMASVAVSSTATASLFMDINREVIREILR